MKITKAELCSTCSIDFSAVTENKSHLKNVVPVLPYYHQLLVLSSSSIAIFSRAEKHELQLLSRKKLLCVDVFVCNRFYKLLISFIPYFVLY